MSVPWRMPLKTPLSKSAMRERGTSTLSQGCGTRHSPILSSATSSPCTRSRNSRYDASRTNASPSSCLSVASTELSSCSTDAAVASS